MVKLAVVSHIDGTDPVTTTTPNTTILDASGNGHNGVLTGPYVQGVKGLVPGDTALYSAGYPGSVTVSNMIDLTGDWTMTGWIEPLQDPFIYSTVFSAGLIYSGPPFSGNFQNRDGDFNAIFQSTSTPGFYYWMQKTGAGGEYIVQFNGYSDGAPSGPHMWAITFTNDTSTVYSSDSFNRGVYNPTTGYPPLAGSQTDGDGTIDPLTWSSAYTTPAQTGTELKILTDKVFLSGGAKRAIGTVQLGISDVFLSALLEIAYLGGIESGMAFRYTDIDNFWFVASQGGEFHVVKRVGGVETQVGQASFIGQQGLEDPISVTVDLSGSSIIATAYWFNNATSSPDSSVITVSDGFNSGATRHGVMVGNDIYPGGFGNSGSVTAWRAGTKPTGSTRLYVDGVVVNAYDDLGIEFLNPHSRVGYHPAFFTDPFINGPIDTFHLGSLVAGVFGPGIRDENAFWNRALSEGDIAGLYGASGSFAGYSAAVLGLGPTSYYHLNEVPTTATTPGTSAQSAIRVIDSSTGVHLAEHIPTAYEPGDLRYIGRPLIVTVRF